MLVTVQPKPIESLSSLLLFLHFHLFQPAQRRWLTYSWLHLQRSWNTWFLHTKVTSESCTIEMQEGAVFSKMTLKIPLACSSYSGFGRWSPTMLGWSAFHHTCPGLAFEFSGKPNCRWFLKETSRGDAIKCPSDVLPPITQWKNTWPSHNISGPKNIKKKKHDEHVSKPPFQSLFHYKFPTRKEAVIFLHQCCCLTRRAFLWLRGSSSNLVFKVLKLKACKSGFWRPWKSLKTWL